MAVEKINYENKLEFQNDPNVPNKNKVTDENMNEIKSKVNNNADELIEAQQNIEDLGQEKSAMSENITNLKNRVITLETDNVTNKSDISEAKQEIINLQESQTAQDNEINQIKGTLANKETEIAKSLHIEDAEGFGKLSVLGNHEQNGEPSEENPVEIKCLGDNKKNLFSLDNKLENVEINFQGIIASSDEYDTYYIEVEEGEEYTFSTKYDNDYYKTAIISWGYFDEIPEIGEEAYFDKRTDLEELAEVGFKDGFSAMKKYLLISILKSVTPHLYNTQLEKGTVATSFVPYGQGSTEIKIENSDKTQDLTYVLPIQQEMLKGDYFLKELDIWKEVHNWQKIDSYNGESIATDYISTTGSLTTGATVFYKLQTPTKIPCTEEQSKILNQLNALDLFEGVNDITTTENIALLQLKYVSNVDEIDILEQEIEKLNTTKVDKVEGKGLSTNDFTDELKTKLENLNNYNDTEVKNDISELQTDMTSVENSISTINTNIANKVDKVEGKGLSTEDFTTALKTKLEGLSNYDDTEIQQDIQDIQEKDLEQDEKLETQNDLIERLKDNQINITTEQSSTINVQDCSNLSAKIDVYGVSSQETRSGKNFFDISKDLTSDNTDYEYTHLDNGYRIKLTQATSGARYMVYSGQIHLEPGQYIFSCLLTVSGGTKSNRGRVRIYNSSGSIIYPVASDIDCNNELKYASFNIEEATDITIAFYYVSNSTIEITENANIYCEWKNIQIEKSSDTQPTEYEDYGASPSPKFPSKIENVTGDIDITKCNKNLFDGVFSQGYDSKGNITSSNQFVCNTNLIDVVENESYTISNNLNLKIASIAYYKDNEFVSFQANLNLATITIPQNVNQIRFNFYKEPTLNISDFIYCQFEKNVVETDYIEHEEQIKTFPLKEGQKMYVGSKTEDDGIHHKRKQIELDGTEDWVLSGSIANNQYILNIPDIKMIGENSKGNLISSHFKEITGVEGYQNNNINGISGWSIKQIRISLDINIVNRNVTEFKNLLAQQKQAGTPVIVEYETEEEIVELYTEAQQEAYNQLQNVTPYKLVTNISTDKAKLQFNYIADTKTYVDNEINSIKEQINTINELLSTTTTSAMLLNNLQSDLESEVL